MELEICARPYENLPFYILKTMNKFYSAIIYRLYFSQLGISFGFYTCLRFAWPLRILFFNSSTLKSEVNSLAPDDVLGS